MNTSIRSLWRLVLERNSDFLGTEDQDLEKELKYNSLLRVLAAVYAFFVIGVIFFTLRILFSKVYQATPGYNILVWVNFIIIICTSLMMIAFYYFMPKSPDKLKPAHALLLHIPVSFFVLTMAVSTGAEYIGTGDVTRLFFTLITICFVLTLNLKTFLVYTFAGWTATAATVYYVEGTMLLPGIQHMHALPPMVVAWIVSRFFHAYSIRGFYIRKELKLANITLTEEIAQRQKILEEMELSRRQLRTLFEKAPDAYIIFDVNKNTFSEINASAESLFMIENKDIADKSVREISFLSSKKADITESIIQKTIDEGFAGPYEFEFTRKDEKNIAIEIYSSLAVIKNRTLLIGAARDVTWRRDAEEDLIRSKDYLEEKVRVKTAHVIKASERLRKEISSHRQTENELRKTEEQSRILIQKMNDGFAVFDRDMTFIYVNDRLCQMLGRSKEWLLNKNLFDLVVPEGTNELRSNLDEHNDKRHDAFETVLVKSDNAKIHTIISPVTLFDSKGEPKNRFSVFTDITRIKEMESAIRKSEEMTLSLINASRDSVVMLDKEGTVLMANHTMAGYLNTNTDDIKSKNIFFLIPSADNPDRKQKLKYVIEKKEPLIYDDCFAGIHYELHIYPITEKDGKVERLAVFARDVTDLRIAEKQIHSLSQELIKIQEIERQRIARDLHDNVAQDLASLKIGCDMILEHFRGDDKEFEEKARGFSKVLHNTIINVRNLAYDLRPPELDQLGLIRTITNYCDEFSERNSIHIDFFTAGMAEIKLSSDTEINLYRIVQEALHNVKKHSSADRVMIRLISSFPDIILRIEDNGKGFDTEKQIKLALSEKRMGLRSMEERALLLKGTISIRAQQEKGTKIIVKIPVKDNTASQIFHDYGDDNEYNTI